ncbi:nucleotidyltransferase family protein [Gaoshiqia sediminis]|uniref:Nucleotidyltransferase family protein n=1 Tax=Gaoshiqia sediminis TaxID=2986998 RepID=A0AA41Y8T2_9BACT|nr:nucleotidyltransferase family protein [Gaoshiqia sediminis]MCW0484149.1 nucleotidyltransferase family protein [Gaoshiqia sediminis]
MKAMIFAAGLGTRLKPLTLDRPKALVELEGHTLLERSIRYLKAYGITDITVNVHHFAWMVTEFLRHHENTGIHLHLSDESEELLDTGGAILKARDFLAGDDPILLMNVDILTNLDLNRLLESHKQSGALASLVVRNRKTSRYLLFDQENQLTGWKNEITGELKICRPHQIDTSTPLAFSGMQLIQPHLLDLITETGKFSIIDLYLRLAATEQIMAFTDADSIWMDLGKYEQLDDARTLARQLDSGLA